MPNSLLTLSPSFLRTLCNLRWVAIVGQAVTVLVALGLLGIDLPRWPLWAGIGALALFNVYATWRSRRPGEETPAEAFAHMAQQTGIATIIVEQQVDEALRYAQRAVVLDHGTVVHEAGAAELLEDEATLERWVGMAVH